MKLEVLILTGVVVTVANAIKIPDMKKVSSKWNPWPLSRGRAPQYGTTEITVPRNLSAHLAWSWHHPLGQYAIVVAGGPVIDSSKNLYLTTSDGFFKFTPEGEVVWHYKPPGRSNNMPALMGDYVYGNTITGHAFALNRETGEPVWVVRPSHSAGGDSGYPATYDGLFVMGTDKGHDPRMDGGNKKVIALDGLSGDHVWEFEVEHPVWNVMPLFPGDDTCVFMGFTGGVYRLGLHNGTLLWHTPAPNSADSFSDGGAILGPNRIVYSCSNPGSSGGGEGQLGALRAFELSDGKMLWEQILPQPCNSWPSVGYLGDSQDLSVVITPGAFMGTLTMHGGIMAFQANTGMPQWQYQAPVYHSPPLVPPIFAAYGDYQGAITRSLLGAPAMCLPAHWSCPTISGDGTIFAGRSDGSLYIVQAPSVTDSDSLPNLAKVSSTLSLGIDYATSFGVQADVFEAKGASLHGAAAFAPGMMAFAT
jgi:outer membrane protein assembly factor BamB